jgi:DnaJ-class molecular chaperone|tara:strand:+ start:808 stop:918 length:111 start_codon:yes stop_codon:yes gene_type:complete
MNRAEALEVLSVADDADGPTIRTAYRAMALIHHPGA